MGIRVGLIGFGTVGQAVARRLTNGRDSRVRLVRVCTRRGGRARRGWLPPSVGWSERFESLLARDIDGFDARAKLSILCSVGLGVRVRPAEIPCASIAHITSDDLARARAAGCAIRQVSSAERIDGRPDRGEARPGLSWLPRPTIASTALSERTA